MEAHEHFAEGQKNLAQAASATSPERLIGLAQGHFLAAQTIILADTYSRQATLAPHVRRAWAAAIAQQFGPDGKPVR